MAGRRGMASLGAPSKRGVQPDHTDDWRVWLARQSNPRKPATPAVKAIRATSVEDAMVDALIQKNALVTVAAVQDEGTDHPTKPGEVISL